MLCPNCGENNSMGSSRCVMCSASLTPEPKDSPLPRKAKDKPNSTVTLCGWVGLVFSIVVFQIAAPYAFSPPIGDGINWYEVACAGIAGSVGMAVGKKSACLLNRPKG